MWEVIGCYLENIRPFEQSFESVTEVCKRTRALKSQVRFLRTLKRS